MQPNGHGAKNRTHDVTGKTVHINLSEGETCLQLCPTDTLEGRWKTVDTLLDRLFSNPLSSCFLHLKLFEEIFQKKRFQFRVLRLVYTPTRLLGAARGSISVGVLEGLE